MECFAITGVGGDINFLVKSDMVLRQEEQRDSQVKREGKGVR